MKTNPVKAALKSGEPQVGTWLSFGNVFATRLMARVGFPWLTIDMEHSPIDWEQAPLLFGAIADAGCAPLVRVPNGDALVLVHHNRFASVCHRNCRRYADRRARRTLRAGGR